MVMNVITSLHLSQETKDKLRVRFENLMLTGKHSIEHDGKEYTDGQIELKWLLFIAAVNHYIDITNSERVNGRS